MKSGRPKTGKYISCTTCGGLFYVKKVHLGVLKNCSVKCFGRWMSKNRIGEKAANWKGGVITDKGGYVYFHNPSHPHANSQGYVFLHRLVVEKALGRVLRKEEVVHHIDGNPGNNDSENLMVFSNNGEHRKFHGKSKK